MKTCATAEQRGASIRPPGVLQACIWSEDTRRASTALLTRSKIEHSGGLRKSPKAWTAFPFPHFLGTLVAHMERVIHTLQNFVPQIFKF